MFLGSVPSRLMDLLNVMWNSSELRAIRPSFDSWGALKNHYPWWTFAIDVKQNMAALPTVLCVCELCPQEDKKGKYVFQVKAFEIFWKYHVFLYFQLWNKAYYPPNILQLAWYQTWNCRVYYVCFSFACKNITCKCPYSTSCLNAQSAYCCHKPHQFFWMKFFLF